MAKSIVSYTQRFYQAAMQGWQIYLQQELHIVPGQDYRVIRASNEPRLLNVMIQINPKHLRRLSNIMMQEELAMACGLAAEQRLRVARGPAGTISLEIPKPSTLCFDITARQLPGHVGILGLDTMRRPAYMDFADPLTPHVLVAGTTGSGKTNTQQLLAWSLARHQSPDESRLLIIDIEKRGRSWSQFSNSAHLAHPVIVDIEEATRALTWCVAELDQRRIQNRTTPRIFIFIDEIQSLLDEEAGCIKPLDRLARVGREFELHLTAGTQHPTIEALGSATFRRNLGARLVSRVDDANAAYVATGKRNTGAEALSGPGDTIFVQPGDIRRLTVAKLAEGDYNHLSRTNQPARLPLADLDPDHVLDVASEPAQAAGPDPLDPGHVAYALATARGINHLSTELSIGSSKAGRIKEFSDHVRYRLRQLGYTVEKKTKEHIQ